MPLWQTLLVSILLTWSIFPEIGVAAEKKKAPLQPLPNVIPSPEDNPDTTEKIALGKQLFFDPRLSGNNKMSCATCHLPDKGFADGLSQARGNKDKPLPRNTPTLLNIAFLSPLFWDGRASTLEEQALGPIQSPDEMNQDLDQLVKELQAIPGYATQFQQVFSGQITPKQIAQALAAFERTLVTKPSPVDRFLAGDQEALSKSAQRGMELFLGDAGCARCHHGPLLSDGKFYRLGVAGEDDGLALVTGKKEDRGKFRTPALRNVAQTGPYMHNGSLKSLNEVVTFYYRGVPTTTTDGLPLDVEPLFGQSFSDITDMVAFLEALSGAVPRITPPTLP